MRFWTPLLNRILPRAVDFIGHAGDTVEDGTLLQQWDDDWYAPLTNAGNLAQTTPLLVTRGNHDGEGPAAYSYLWLPENGSYYAETIGRTRLIDNIVLSKGLSLPLRPHKHAEA